MDNNAQHHPPIRQAEDNGAAEPNPNSAQNMGEQPRELPRCAANHGGEAGPPVGSLQNQGLMRSSNMHENNLHRQIRANPVPPP